MKALGISFYRWYSRLSSIGFLKIRVGRGCLFQGRASIRIKGGQIVIGNQVTINSCRWSNPLNVAGSTSLYTGPGATLELKDGAGISGCQIIAYDRVEIGSQSLVGAGCLICDSDMHEIPLGADVPPQCAPIIIGARVFLGARCIVLKGVSIGDGTVVGAGSVVVRDLPAGVVAGGNPAKVLRKLDNNGGSIGSSYE